MNKYFPIRNNRLSFSFLMDRKAIIVLVLLTLAVIATMIVSTGMGDVKISPIEVVQVLIGNGSELNALVVNTFRLPRILIGFLVGASLGVAGAILQGVFRNPLASPDIIGITGGAGVAVVTFLAFLLDPNDNSLKVSIHWLPLAAFIGAALIAFLIYILSWKNGVTPIRLVLVGVGLDVVTRAVMDVMMIFGPLILATQSKIWITGSINGSTWDNVWTLLPWVAFIIPFTFIIARNLNIQELGDDIAKGVGSAVQWQRFTLLLVGTALAGGAVAFAGGIGFVGLMGPHIARQLVGSSYGALLPVSALVGGLIVLVADLVARTAFLPLDIPAGVFTSVIGAPYFIYLLYRSRNA